MYESESTLQMFVIISFTTHNILEHSASDYEALLALVLPIFTNHR